MPTWPVPPPEVEEVGPPEGWTAAPDAPPSTMFERDGSIWLCDRGEARRVAPPGTNHHKVRFDARALPAIDLLHRRCRNDHELERSSIYELIEDVIELVDGDDIALLMAQAFAGRAGLKRMSEGDTEQAELWRRIVDVLDSALWQAQHAGLPETGQDEIRAAVARHRDRSS